MQHLRDRDVARRPAQAVAALLAALADDEVRAVERRRDRLHIFQGHILPLRHGLERDEALVAMLRQVDHQAQRIASLG